MAHEFAIDSAREPSRTHSSVTPKEIRYKRCRFTTRLRDDRLYTAGHYWLEPEEEGLWRVGYTRFAMRMLGEVVDLDFDTKIGATIERGQVLGWLEGFKAITDIFAPVAGQFEGANPALDTDIGLLTIDAHGGGWLFKVRGNPEDQVLDVQGYISLLDATIDNMIGDDDESS